jgi:sulfite exporter TauE/SafE
MESGAAAGVWSAATLWTVFLVGLAGGFGHCVAMCGPIVTASGLVSGTASSASGASRTRAVALWQLGYHGGRLLTYSAIGALLGGVGSLAAVQGAIGPLQRWVWLAAGVIMVVMGLAVAGAPLFSRLGRAVEAGTATATQGWFGRAYGSLASAGPGAAVPIGMLMGLLPCGFLLSVEASALGSGSALLGAATMLAFGFGTVPALAGFGAAGGLLGARGRTWLLYGGGAAVATLGVFYIARAAGVLMNVPR